MIVATSASAREPLRLRELPSRPLRAGELRIGVRAIGVNPVDWKMRQWSFLGIAQRVLGPSGPLVVGMDYAGVVTEVTAGVALQVGARVVGGTNFSRRQRGSYATEVVVRADQCAALPDNVSFEDAACLPVPGASAWQAMQTFGAIRSKPGAKVLVLGASGGVGLVAIQVAAVLGARAYGVCSGKNAALVKRLGATVFDYTAGDALEQAKAEAPFDVVINAVGSTYPGGVCRTLLTPSGTLALVVVGPSDFPAIAFSPRTRTILGKPMREVLEPLVAAMAAGSIKPVIADRLPLAQAEEAHARSRAGKVVGKIVLLPPVSAA
jgi:NADPH:quinone reductase-like Zn-dependent oxidoreductase